MRKCRSPKSAQQGVVLIEAMLAIVIFSIGVLAVVGLQAAMIKNADDSKFRAEASYIAQKRIGEMWADPANIGTYIETDTNISTMLPGGKRTVTQTAAGQYQVTVRWTRPGADATERNFTTTAYISGN
jgi:type IV pilus assembly protein PilV